MPLQSRVHPIRRTALVLALASIVTGSGLSAQSGLDRLVPPSPTPAGFIHDGGPVLSAADLSGLNAQVTAHQAAGRGDIGVAILRDIGDYPPYEVGLAIYRSWRIGSVDSIGSARRDLGALLLVVPKELAPDGKGQCWITTGLGAEAYLTDAEAGAICREAIIPRLREQDYAGAVRAGIDEIGERLSGLPPGSVASTSGQPGPSGGVPGGLIALLSVGGAGAGAVALVRRKRRKPRLCPNGHGRMTRLSESSDDAALAAGQLLEEQIKSVDYDVWECPVCRERLVLRYKRWFTSYSECPQCKFWTVKSTNRTVVPATRLAGGLAEVTRRCRQCKFEDVRQHATPRITSSSSSSGSGGGSSSSGGSSFGGSGSSAGGGGGSSY